MIVKPKKVKKARELAEQRKSNPALGRTKTAKGVQLGPCNNILKGITSCRCGAATTDTTRKSRKYLDVVCSAQNSCRECTVPTRQCWKVNEELLLESVMRRRWEQFFKNPATGTRIRELEERLLDEQRVAGQYRTTANDSRANLQRAMEEKDADLDLLKMLGEIFRKRSKPKRPSTRPGRPVQKFRPCSQSQVARTCRNKCGRR